MLNYGINTTCEGLLPFVFLMMTKRWILLNNTPISRQEYKIHTLFMAKLVVKTAENPYPRVPPGELTEP